LQACTSSGWGNFWEKPILTAFALNGQSATIDGTSIKASLKWANAANLVATFSSNAKSVLVAGVAQKNGITSNDFSTPRTYELVGENGATITYSVSVTQITFPFADTGQNACYNATVATPCPDGTFTRQDADFPNIPAARSFTGPTAHPTYTTDYTTKDNVTGLVWKSCSEGMSGPACASGAASLTTWTYANETACTSLNTQYGGAGYGGYANWRLPSIEEIRTLVNASVTSPSTDQAAFPATQGAIYWSSSTVLTNSNNAWTISFTNGFYTGNAKTNSYHTRCVAGGGGVYQPALADNGNGTITDSTNGLLWAKCSLDGGGAILPYASNCTGTVGTITWQNALQNCTNLVFANRSWRLPSLAELTSIIDMTQTGTTLNQTIFPATLAGIYWTSTTSSFSFVNAMFNNFAGGSSSSGAKASVYSVRCVSGP